MSKNTVRKRGQAAFYNAACPFSFIAASIQVGADPWLQPQA